MAFNITWLDRTDLKTPLSATYVAFASIYNTLKAWIVSPVQKITDAFVDTDIIVDGTKEYSTTKVIAGATHTITASDDDAIADTLSAEHKQGNELRVLYQFDVDCTITLTNFESTGNNTGTITPIPAGSYNFKFKANARGINLVIPQNVGAGGIDGHVIENAGTPLAQQANLNFTGEGVTASDSGGKTVVNIPASSVADPNINNSANILGEFNVTDFTFDQATGILDQPTKTAEFYLYWTNKEQQTFINGGQNYYINNFDCHPDASDDINVVYFDYKIGDTLSELYASAIANLPSVTTGYARIFAGVCQERSGLFYFTSSLFQFPREVYTNIKYPWVDNTYRDADLDAIIDIRDVKVIINEPSDIIVDGRFVRIYPQFIKNGPDGLIWIFYEDFNGNNLGFASTVSSLPELSGIQTVLVEENTQSGIKIEMTINWDLLDAGVLNTLNDPDIWSFQEGIMQEAMNDWLEASAKKLDYSSVFIEKLPLEFKQTYYNNEDVEVTMFGDSIITGLIFATETDTPENNPPSGQNNYLPQQIFEGAVKNKPVYDRFDSALNAFTESGTFEDGEPFPTSNFWKKGGALTRYSDDANAYIEWDWDLASYEKLNLIFAKDDAVVNNVTLTVAEGNTQVEVYDVGTTSWIEANGYVFNQIADAADTGTGKLGWTVNVRLKMRRVAVTGTITTRLAKGNNADFIYYWGTERWNGQGLFFTNSGFFNNRLFQLEQKYVSEIFDIHRYSNLILYELSLINEVDAADTVVNDHWDFIWGDRPGFENANSLKNLTNDFADNQLLLVLPHMVNSSYSETEETVDEATIERWNKIKNLIETKGDVGYIDMNAILVEQARNRGISLYNVTKSYTANYADFYTYLGDAIHMNDLGAELYSRFLSPLFW